MPTFVDARGVTIFYDHYPAIGAERAVVQLLHGVGEHAGRYTRLAHVLAERGYTVYADDHRGHGRTGMAQHHGDASKLGRLGKGGLAAALDACGEFTERIRGMHPDVPLVLLGHSWGSFLAQMLVNRHPDAYQALVLSGSALRWPGSLNSRPLNARWDGPGASGTEWLASDPAVGRSFVEDPLCTSTPLAVLFGPFDTLRLIGKPGKNLSADIPTLLMVGRDDPVGGPRSVHRLAAAYRGRSGFTDVTTLVYPDVRHEIFNDVSQQQVRTELLAWLDARVAVAGASSAT